MTVYAQRCGDSLTVACDLNALDQGVDLGRVYTLVIPDYVPFDGFLGVTASTGDARQNHILHSAKLEALPLDFCLQPVGEATRDITIANPNANICGDYTTGTIANVTLTLSNLRQADACCSAAGRPPEAVGVTEPAERGGRPRRRPPDSAQKRPGGGQAYNGAFFGPCP